MPRPEKPIDEGSGPAAEFAAALRRLRAEAGSPSYRKLSVLTCFSPAVLSAATRGARLPTWPVAEAVVLACGGDGAKWRFRWEQAAQGEADRRRSARAEERTPSRALPAAARQFTGRTAELEWLLGLVGEDPAAEPVAGPDGSRSDSRDRGQRHSRSDGRSHTSQTIVICAVDGMAGIGKTALCLHAAHELVPRYPDGQLYADLHGFTPGQDPRSPEDVLGTLLAQLGVDAEHVPPRLDERAWLYRSRLAGTRTLIMLDNAGDEGQILPLLPGSGSCLVLVTSRRRLAALDDAHILTLDALPLGEAVSLLRRVGGPRAAEAAEPEIEHVVELCGLLPLSIVIAGALLRHRPAWTVAHLIGMLRDAEPGLHGFFDGRRDLAAAFRLSYTALEPPQQRLLRNLSLGGADIDTRAAAALLGVSAREAAQLLQTLFDHHLIGEPTAGRFRMHDLMRRFARELSDDSDNPADRAAAVRRLAGWYLASVAAARAVLIPSLPPMVLPELGSGPPPATFEDRDAALDWCEAERANLVAMTQAAMNYGHDDLACRLPIALYAFFELRKHFDDWIVTHRIAIEAAGRLGELENEGRNLCNLGNAYRPLRQFEEAVRCYAEALDRFERCGYRQGEAKVLGNLSSTFHEARLFSKSIDTALRALALFEGLDDVYGQALTLSNLGNSYSDAGEQEEAERLQRRALELFLAEGDRHGQARATSGLGLVVLRRGRPAEAESLLAAAAAIFEEVKDEFECAAVLLDQARARGELGRGPEAVDLCLRAVEIYERIGDTYHRERAATALAQLRGDPPGCGDCPGPTPASCA